ncbi:MAG TPA: hypothetical protein VK509_21005, partial [Polyangiales bacterium]|nr:hypothetical protein [Polyangiales bacterium]
MKRWLAACVLAASSATSVCACGGETEGKVVPLLIAVEPEPDDGAALGELTTSSGWHVQLTEAQLGIAALYLYTPRHDGQAAVAQLLDLLVPVAHAHGAF